MGKVCGLQKNLGRKNFVENHVLTNFLGVKELKKIGKEDVYCMKVHKNGNFIANGIIVKNCDALRYAVFSHKVNSFDQQEHNRKHHEWMQNKYNPGSFYR